ncbi:VOC family protein [Nocardioides currus]|uniref:Glyoxalase n=1 Tax=Nocardioides currus TaxID=2133958 RepID=A0A2R7YYN9_9ACTN|nr:VOC family protein [Nocardioides currus]PUA81424.1 glyoxalase [Nocardioides currus]
METQRTYPEGVTSWIDLEHPDPSVAQEFYGGLLGWRFVETGGGAYLIAQLDGQDVAGISSGEGRTWTTYVAVDDAEAAAARVVAAGGRVVSPPTAFGPAGTAAYCEDPEGVAFALWQAGTRLGAQLTNAPGAWNFSDLHTTDPAAATAFYGSVFGWEVSDLGFATMIGRSGYGDHLAATVDPGIHERQSGVGVPPGFADAIGWLAPTTGDERPHWHVTFTVADRDATVAAVERLGGTVLATADSAWTRTAEVRDPAGAVFTASQFTPPAG